MNEKIPFDGIGPETDVENYNPGALLILHNVWREIFDKKDETEKSEDFVTERE